MVVYSVLDDWEPWGGQTQSVVTVVVVKGKAVMYSVSKGTTAPRDDVI